ncbi:uncharacterized protein HRG_02138 [Hirsutella rhossiliensis]|uniref:Uncharacterized protein n=1 Tax=Hirsutella rhossiliensis TaxID=111463 RepID=A0A9P8N4M0_9HYPO|nr:uncharacterized protein HRG_02138 [Hirsutella rhossiliensis]KAH0966729.1 hypothetical protein HRG_02138 [Hirsutella rhossiliensis]
MERARQQPDFSQVAHNFRDAAEHFERCENLPAVDGGARLLERMELMMERFTALEQTMNRRFDQVDRRMDGLDRKVIVSNRNAVVRARNGTVVRGDMDLVPLHSVLTGEVIDGFPRNHEMWTSYCSTWENPSGSAAEKKKNLKFATGLVTREL